MSSPSWSGGGILSADDVAAALGLPGPTDEQRAVIEAPPVPALVVAGAGSGKTETMSSRVVWLVANGHVRSDEVLGLTFTRKAAGELAERIGRRLRRIDEYARRGLLPVLGELVAAGELSGLPSDAAERGVLLDRIAARRGRAPVLDTPAEALLLRPRVSTYNAFAHALVREHGARIGRDPDAALLSPSASWLLVRSLVLRSDDPVLQDRDFAISAVVDAVSSLAGDALDHRADLAEIEEFGARAASSFEPFVNHGLQSPNDITRAWAASAGLPLIARLAAGYAQAKREQGVIDFADQVAGALQIVESSPDVAALFRQQYRVVLLDEYQDTSVIQTQLLGELFRDAAVMAVGDPNQAIYGWRGASADNLAAFPDAFAQGVAARRYDLSVSWRNDERILVAANALLDAAGSAKRMSVPPLRSRPGAGSGQVSVVFENTIEEEAEAVAEWFEQVRRTHVATGKPVAEHSGAILFRAKKHMAVFADALEHRGIPHRLLGLGGLLQAPEVADVVSVLRVVDDPAAGSSLIRILAGPRFGIGVADLGALHELARTLSRRDAALQPFDEELLARLRGSAGVDEQVSIIDALEFLRTARGDYRLLSGISEAGRRRLREAAEMFARLRRGVAQPIPDLIRQIEMELRLDIELAVNETRGPARQAATQLRTFAEEVRSFLAVSDRGTLGALLAWLDHAEDADELMPRPEPVEPGVVQLLTIHGSKGLEWDATAVVRLVADELPKRPRSSLGWLSLGSLPHRFRGDRDALPELDWRPTPQTTAKELTAAIGDFKAGMKSYQEAEERRLAYVAVTRARTELLLSGSWWGGQSHPRKPSSYLTEMMAGLGLEPLEGEAEEENPYESREKTLRWPMDALGSRRAIVEGAAAAVRAAVPTEPGPELVQLLAEREARLRGAGLEAPTRVPASRFKDFVADFAGTVRAIARPLPERPYRQTRLGTLFHSWVEQRSGLVGAGSSLDGALWESDEDALETASGFSPQDAEDLSRLQRIFENSEWAGRAPIAVELEINFSFGGGDASRIIICKLDAVYRREDRAGRVEIVDWKTGRAPKNQEEREERMLQLALYRLAYHRRFGVPLEEIDVALYYVADDLIIRDDRIYSESDLLQRWSAARAAR